MSNYSYLPQDDETFRQGPSAASWDQLRKEARKLEQEIDTKLLQFSRTLSSIQQPSSSLNVASGGGEKDALKTLVALEKNLDSLFTDLQDIMDQMVSGSSAGGGHARTGFAPHMVKRHQEIYQDYRTNYTKLKSSFTFIKNQHDLLDSVERARHDPSSAALLQDRYIHEQMRIDESHRMTDMVLEQAYETRNELHRQRSSLVQSGQRLGSMVARLPLVQSLMRSIAMKRSRDTLVMAAVISFCIIFIIYLKS